MTNAGTAAATAATGVAAALGARTARSCDGCMRRRARWHCPADDAFLCQACDAAVHSANPLARRHHRAASSSSAAVPDLEAEEEDSASGIVGDDDIDMSDQHGLLSLEEEDEDLLYRVPEFDPMLAELYNPVAEADDDKAEQKPPPACLISSLAETTTSSEFIIASGSMTAEADGGLSAFDVPDMELASFAADMECLLMGVEEGFDDLGFLDEEKPQVMNLGFAMDHHQFEVTTAAAAPEEQREEKKRKRPEMILKLDYEGVIASWARDGGSSPWFHGERPRLDPGGYSWPDLFTAGIRGGGLVGNVTAVTGGEREARVSRYREKRRTRLFAKKIRYEVRKLNAEKRPRMKGRFVKRTALPPLPRPPQTQQMKPVRAQPPAAGMVLAPQMGVHGPQMRHI
ncbi:hypothetical protein PR202_gb11214 [Eleusine coracana subsp. coracana]|uniref:Uncharacterized protein n=1 Tax=Eleusine coracana subsp. coracana TaxID=191504 RepID=A0AAV5EM01_ELECO|nr:hypothetical protein PR202_gb11214 [Eleusine coracana subsp. coracana]